MKNFKIVTNKRFTVDANFYRRSYTILKKSSGLIKITNVNNGKVLFDNLNPDDIYIDDVLMTNTKQLQDIVFNSNCYCDPDNEDNDYTIFDKTFDKTFE